MLRSGGPLLKKSGAYPKPFCQAILENFERAKKDGARVSRSIIWWSLYLPPSKHVLNDLYPIEFWMHWGPKALSGLQLDRAMEQYQGIAAMDIDSCADEQEQPRADFMVACRIMIMRQRLCLFWFLFITYVVGATRSGPVQYGQYAAYPRFSGFRRSCWPLHPSPFQY